MKVELNETNINILSVHDSIDLGALFENESYFEDGNASPNEDVVITEGVNLSDFNCWGNFAIPPL